MALFDNMKESLLYDPLDIFNEFDAGSGTNQNDEDEELETIEDDETEDPEDADDTQDANPGDDQEDEELETIEDDEADQTETDTQADEQPEQNQTGNDETQPADNNQNQEGEGETTDDAGEGEGDINPNDGSEGDEELETIDDDNDGLDGGDDTDDGQDDTSTDENDPHKKLKELEAEIFDQLSEEEKEMKRNELKKLYVLLIEKAESIFNLTQEITKTDDTVKLIDYVLNTLMDLKTYLGDYVSDVYDNRTYLQNNVNFQKFLAIFDSIHAIFQEIAQMDEKKY
mgnify:CR=1 FL=1